MAAVAASTIENALAQLRVHYPAASRGVQAHADALVKGLRVLEARMPNADGDEDVRVARTAVMDAVHEVPWCQDLPTQFACGMFACVHLSIVAAARDRCLGGQC